MKYDPLIILTWTITIFSGFLFWYALFRHAPIAGGIALSIVIITIIVIIKFMEVKNGKH